MNLMELFVKIGVDDQASSKVSTISDKIGGGLKTAADIGVKAITAASGAIAGLTGLAIKNYAEYEQLVGGVDTLFKESSKKVQQYAAEAYTEAGMSANYYMENVTSFSAALIGSLEGDTEAAAEAANRAMIAMSDNANKMGTDIDMVVQTYQSLSRGNYAMLDNLKLGYGGTKAELERLIADAATYTDIQREMGITVDESSMSFDNIVNAIAVVQGHLGIAGATADEAATTIQGSVLAMKAAFDNLITGVADDEADFNKLIDNFVTSTGIAAKNILPRINIALKGVGKLIDKLFPVIMDEIPTIITDTLPTILKSAVNIVKTISEGLLKNLNLIIETAIDLILTLANGLVKALPKMIPFITKIITQIVNTLTKPSTLVPLVNAALQIIVALANGLIKVMPQLLKQAPVIVKNLVASLIKSASLLLSAAAQMIATIVKGITERIGTIINVGLSIPKAIGKGIANGITAVVSKAKNLGSKVLSAIRNKLSGASSIGRNLVEGLWRGVSDKVGWVTEKMASFGKKVINSLKSFFGIKSPSRLMRDEVGRYLAEGVAVGFIENDPMKEIERTMSRSVKAIAPSVSVNGAFVGGSAGGGVSVVQNIYSQAKTAADLMQEALYQQKRAVYMGV